MRKENKKNANQTENERAFSFLRVNERQGKPRKHGLTEIRGPYYTPMGRRYLEDILETMGEYVDILKFAGGSFSLMPHRAVKELIDLCHKYIEECKRLEFDIIEISSGFITVPQMTLSV